MKLLSQIFSAPLHETIITITCLCRNYVSTETNVRDKWIVLRNKHQLNDLVMT